MEKITKYINGPMGSKFEENLKQQWINFHMSSCDYGFFALFNNNPGFSSKNLLHNLHEIKHLCNSQIPIGFLINNTSSLGKANIEGPVLQSLLFTSPINSQHLYFQWLRQRKIWWSRFSVYPGHILIQDLLNNEGDQNFNDCCPHQLNSLINLKLQNINIVVKIDEQNLPIETIGLYEQDSKRGLYMQDNSGETLPHIIISSINLRQSCIGILRECLDASNNLILHHNLAPFQYRIICECIDMDDANELIDLGQYLCGLLRKAHISTLFTNNNNLSLNEVLKQSDQIGIPYCLILRSNSLKNGFVYLRNRDTTLEEQIHVSDIPKYLEKLCKK
ncbi:DNA polymerase subunit gamma-2, mitochondrial [Ctenocephalides felis]|uniref:DNA polymerase subunit gamma-2, mitochondrial n=1 Tax=Ctenocephalides felis TaxID=7515 RepID=UPI000E6E506E|nr:DNA polymerase subunit gamma-2, mitochondrial [Ctenocephalides felis]XP_026474124.1 DNA polymerase subunit gamma-2, mitochondrial [Ctenocephalides felis]